MPRKALDGAKLAADIDRLGREDKISPPAAQPSLMDAVRGLATYIETRAKLGWTDATIAVVLTNAGYPISAETLCSYRKRLRDEGLMEPLPAGKRKDKTRPTMPNVVPVPTPNVKTAPAVRDAMDMPLTDAPPQASVTTVIPATEEAAVARAPPPPDQVLTSTRTPTRTFRVNPTNFPPDRA